MPDLDLLNTHDPSAFPPTPFPVNALDKTPRFLTRQFAVRGDPPHHANQPLPAPNTILSSSNSTPPHTTKRSTTVAVIVSCRAPPPEAAEMPLTKPTPRNGTLLRLLLLHCRLRLSALVGF